MIGFHRGLPVTVDGVDLDPVGLLSRINEVAGRLSDLSAFLGDRDFYYADVPSVADLSVYGMLRVLHDGPMTGARELIDERPELLAYMKRMDERTRSGLEQPALALPVP